MSVNDANRPPAALAQRAAELLRARLGVQAQLVARAPGRVNLIGEHTDYNDGYVLPLATHLATYIAAAPRPDDQVRVYSEYFSEVVEFSLASLRPVGGGVWGDYLRGVAWSLQTELADPRQPAALGPAPAPVELRGLDAAIVSDLPPGGGLSSSAALEVAWAVALLAGAGLNITALDKRWLAWLCQRAENEFVGMQCGIMDQLASLEGKRDHALFLDCRTLQAELVPLPAQEVAVVIMNTGKPRALVDSEYNLRRQQCAAAARALQVASLRDATLADLEAARGRLDEVLYRRARHVLTENARVRATVEALRRSDWDCVGELLNQSHFSLAHDYQVSCPELDLICEIARAQEGCYGARLVGAGFGGCALALVEPRQVETFIPLVTADYNARAAYRATLFAVRAADGAGLVPPPPPGAAGGKHSLPCGAA
jgi:galactokinase